MQQSVLVDLMAAQSRVGAQNRATIGLYVAGRGDFRDLFVAAYDLFAPRLSSAPPGLAVVAVREASGQLAAVAHLLAKPGEAAAAIVGRHGCSDVYLDESESMALRHVAIVVDPLRRWAPGHVELSYRILDLRTGRGFVDEHGRKLDAVRSEGPAFVHLEGYALFFLVTGDPSDWPASASDAWDILPERVYFEDHAHIAAQAAPSIPSRRITNITLIGAPRALDRPLIEPGEEPVGRIRVDSPRGRFATAIGETALREGILFGRYDRCQTALLFADPNISRVHVLLTSSDGAAVAIDTGSTGGTLLNGRQIDRAARLPDRAEIQLGEDTRIVWHRR